MKKYITPEILQTGMILGGLFLVYRLLRPAGAKEQQQTATTIKSDIVKEESKGEQQSQRGAQCGLFLWLDRAIFLSR